MDTKGCSAVGLPFRLMRCILFSPVAAPSQVASCSIKIHFASATAMLAKPSTCQTAGLRAFVLKYAG